MEEPVSNGLRALAGAALNDLEGVFDVMPEDALDELIEEIVKARRIVVFGLGREGLQMRGLAMRLFHMGRSVAVWGDMTTRSAGARTALVTAQPANSPDASTSSPSFRRRRWPTIAGQSFRSCRWARC